MCICIYTGLELPAWAAAATAARIRAAAAAQAARRRQGLVRHGALAAWRACAGGRRVLVRGRVEAWVAVHAFMCTHEAGGTLSALGGTLGVPVLPAAGQMGMRRRVCGRVGLRHGRGGGALNSAIIIAYILVYMAQRTCYVHGLRAVAPRMHCSTGEAL